MQSIQVFNNPAFGNIRVAGTEENPQFCLADVCKALGLTAKFVNQRLAKEVVSNHPLETAGGTQQALFVNEDGLYDVILDSRKTEARQFRKWITSEVLPTIRKHGAYMTEGALQKAIQNPDFLIQLATELKNEKQSSSSRTEWIQDNADYSSGFVVMGTCARRLANASTSLLNTQWNWVCLKLKRQSFRSQTALLSLTRR